MGVADPESMDEFLHQQGREDWKVRQKRSDQNAHAQQQSEAAAIAAELPKLWQDIESAVKPEASKYTLQNPTNAIQIEKRSPNLIAQRGPKSLQLTFTGGTASIRFT